jgi:serine/threonine-protein kinase
MPMTTDPDHDPLVGQLVGNYRVVKLIGKGGMGAVYLATHQTIGKQVALKVLLPELTARADISARFVQEAISAAHVRGPNGRTHRNVVEPVDTGTLPDGQHYIMVEYLDGCDLEQYVTARGGRLAEDEVLAIAFQTCAALHAAHTARDPHSPHSRQLAPIVHRDLKLANLFMTRDDTGRQLVKLLDFGIAKVAGAVRATGIQTGAGQVMGSPAYMAPEQVRAPLSVDARADIYALGVVLYQLLTGRLPHVADNAMGYVLAKQEQTPPPISALAPGVSRLWDVIVARCLTWEAAHRYGSVRLIVNDLVEGTQGLPGIPDAAAILSAAWPTFWTDASPNDETTRAAMPAAHAPPPQWPSGIHATGGTLAAAAGARSSTTAPRRRTGLAIAGVGVLLVGAGLAALVATRGDERRGSPATSPSSATAPAPPASSSTATPASTSTETATSATPTPTTTDAAPPPATDASSSPTTAAPSAETTSAETTTPATSTRPATTTTRMKPTRSRSKPAKPATPTPKKKAGDIGRID